MGPGFYLHVPFCARKCPYCDFYSLETRRSSATHTEFLDALGVELKLLPDTFRPVTLFMGGGTPTELSEPDLQRMLDLLTAHLDLRDLREWTCEANPGTCTPAKADLLRAAGVNRISMGAQSFNPVHLAFLGRIHDPADSVASYHLLRKAGFTNINLDLMYGLPGSDIAQTQFDIHEVVRLAPEHASCYGLIFEPGTPLMARKQRGEVQSIDEELEREQYEIIRTTLIEAGYEQYEISNFARPGHACTHNLLYWGGGEYIGCGPSAHSHWNGQRYANVRGLQPYCQALQKGESPVTFAERLEGPEKARETLIMWLRRLDGVPRDAFREATGYDYHHLCGPAIEHLCAIGVLTEENECLRLTEEGVYISDSVFAELV